MNQGRATAFCTGHFVPASRARVVSHFGQDETGILMVHFLAITAYWGKMIKAIFWDNDGLLVDTERLYYLATQRVLEAVGVPLTKEQHIELLLVKGRGVWHLAAEKGVTPDAIEKLRQERNTLYGELLEKEDIVIEGVQAVLKALHGRYVMGIVTSSLPDHFAIIHRRTGFLKYVQFVLTMGDYSHSKPHPEPYLLAVERTGFHKEECLVVEDSERGLTAAREAGIRCIVVPNQFTRGSDFAGAYKVIDHLDEILALL
jgi:HAD superfamily hydrolase (TIGR01509 family)